MELDRATIYYGRVQASKGKISFKFWLPSSEIPAQKQYILWEKPDEGTTSGGSTAASKPATGANASENELINTATNLGAHTH